jgi:hypothetical protein
MTLEGSNTSAHSLESAASSYNGLCFVLHGRNFAAPLGHQMSFWKGCAVIRPMTRLHLGRPPCGGDGYTDARCGFPTWCQLIVPFPSVRDGRDRSPPNKDGIPRILPLHDTSKIGRQSRHRPLPARNILERLQSVVISAAVGRMQNE